jgi:ABC-type glycerol-3-phosphate transport system substrate-binding protein
MFVKLAGAVLVAAGLLAVGVNVAEAQQVELSKLRCREFIDLPKETIANITLWLDGYYTDEEDPAVVDFDKIKIKVEKLVAHCAQNPKTRVMTAAEDVIVK